MCKSTHPQQSDESGAAAAAAPAAVPCQHQQQQQQSLEADYTVKSFELDLDQPADQRQEGQHQEVLSRDESSGVVVFGCFVAGALVGIIISAPAFIVLLFGAGAAALTKSDSKVCTARVGCILTAAVENLRWDGGAVRS